MRWSAVYLLLAVCTGCGAGGGASHGPSSGRAGSSGQAGIRLETVARGLESPVAVAGVPGTDELAVVEKTGRVLLLRNGRIAGSLLDLRGHVSTGSEQGLLSIAFDPRYAENRTAYVDYTDVDGNTHIARLDTRTGRLRTILFVRQPYANHNGGGLAFGPDGLLYVGMGDGGSEGDPQGYGQNRSSLLGKILRLDVSQRSPRPQVYAYGLRNPWRISFDAATGDLWIGDVGQNRYEEVDRLTAGAAPGANLGWNAYEGDAVYTPQRIDRSRLVRPVAVYSHRYGCAITGGYVYRGASVPALRGSYVYGDYCSGDLWAIPTAGGRAHRLAVPSVPGLSSFGLGTNGELYAVSLSGSVLRFSAGA